jgi:hypothetical protein
MFSDRYQNRSHTYGTWGEGPGPLRDTFPAQQEEAFRQRQAAYARGRYLTELAQELTSLDYLRVRSSDPDGRGLFCLSEQWKRFDPAEARANPHFFGSEDPAIAKKRMGGYLVLANLANGCCGLDWCQSPSVAECLTTITSNWQSPQVAQLIVDAGEKMIKFRDYYADNPERADKRFAPMMAIVAPLFADRYPVWQGLRPPASAPAAAPVPGRP